MRYVAVIEKVARIQSAVAQEFVGGAVKVVGSVGGDDVDLRARTFSVVCAVGILYHRKFTYGVDAQKLTARSSGRVVDFGGAGEFHAVQQEKVLLRTAAGNRKHVSDHGIRSSDAAGTLRGVVDDSRIQRK